ncbi:MAG: hypothetical protein K6L75_02395 [Cellvibrionaceae bacterium]
MKNEQKTLIAPPFISDAEHKNSYEHLQNCLAWTWIKTKTRQEIEEKLTAQEKQNKQLAALMKDRIQSCLAWLWLVTLTREQISDRLNFLIPSESQRMKEHLNDLKKLKPETTKEKNK